MEICVDARMVHNSGIGTVLLNFLENFNDEFSLALIGSERYLLPLVKGKSKVIIINTEIGIYTISEQIAFPWLIPSCDIFWSPHYNVPLLPIRARKRVVTIHDVYHLAFRQTLDRVQQLYSSMFINQAVSRSNCVVTVSDFSKSEIIKHTSVNPELIEVFHNGVDVNLFHEIRDSVLLLRTREKYKLPDRFILCVGNVKPHKNLKQLILAVKILQNSIHDYKLVIVGKKEGFRTNDPILLEMINNDPFLTDRIIFTGYVSNEDLVNLYNLASLFVFPSIYEGFGLPPLEAMASGCPTLVSNAASIPEVCGDSARYFDPNDPNDIAVRIEDALSDTDNNQYYIEKGINRAYSFSWKKNYRQHIELFNKLLSL